MTSPMGNPHRERRYGRLRISRDFLEDLPDHVIALVFGTMRILRAEHVIFSNEMHYEACSSDFDQLEEGEEPPWYQVVSKKKRDGDVSAEIVRVNDAVGECPKCGHEVSVHQRRFG